MSVYNHNNNSVQSWFNNDPDNNHNKANVSVWHRNWGVLRDSFDLVSRKFCLLWHFSFSVWTGAGEVWAQTPPFGMAVWTEGALLATESHGSLWEGSSYLLLLLWSGEL
jgi:hypothetical protein